MNPRTLENIKEIPVKKFYNIGEFAELSGLSKSKLRDWSNNENGEIKPHHYTDKGYRQYSYKQLIEYLESTEFKTESENSFENIGSYYKESDVYPFVEKSIIFLKQQIMNLGDKFSIDEYFKKIDEKNRAIMIENMSFIYSSSVIDELCSDNAFSFYSDIATKDATVEDVIIEIAIIALLDQIKLGILVKFNIDSECEIKIHKCGKCYNHYSPLLDYLSFNKSIEKSDNVEDKYICPECEENFEYCEACGLHYDIDSYNECPECEQD